MRLLTLGKLGRKMIGESHKPGCHFVDVGRQFKVETFPWWGLKARLHRHGAKLWIGKILVTLYWRRP